MNQPGTYWLGVTANGGCPGRDSVVVTPKTCLTGFYMPSAFTPNHDGKNDLFKPVIGGVALQYKLTIYNRWGQVVFSSGDPAKGWDGSKSAARLTRRCLYGFAATSCRGPVENRKRYRKPDPVMLKNALPYKCATQRKLKQV